MYILYYDAQCPVCTAFVRSLRRKLPVNRITFQPTDPSENQFKLKTSKGNLFYGDKALDVLIKEFPIVKSYFSMLPKGAQASAVKATVKVGSTVRKAIKAVKRNCNCGKRR